jgi:hypothetical protein
MSTKTETELVDSAGGARSEPGGRAQRPAGGARLRSALVWVDSSISGCNRDGTEARSSWSVSLARRSAIRANSSTSPKRKRCGKPRRQE